MANEDLSASVGRGGVNRRDDVIKVQNLLLARGFSGVGAASGVCDAKTEAAIVAFQAGFLRRPDGVIDPGGRTWRHLSASFTGSSDDAPAPGDAITQPLPRPPASSINIGLQSVGNDFMLGLLGSPLPPGSFNAQCQVPTLPKLRRNLVTDTVGPFRVTGLVPAVLSLKAVMIDIAREQPAVHAALGTAGMLCCRLVRGSATSISNHSWGTAIDLTLNGVLDVHGDDRVQRGLMLIAPIFNRHGWFWGAAFRKEDGMHFEGSRAALEQWATQLA
jgi:peptidoglycan hydrolase-like protein with peptidoglycan-binding domain